jgi:hydroxyacylglutathione hydrolase
MQIKKIVSSKFSTNIYLLWDEKSKNTIIIDPSGNSEDINECIRKNKLLLTKIINTHGHFDHIGLNKYLQDKYKAKIYISKFDAEMLSDSEKNASNLTGHKIENSKAEVLLNDGDEIVFGETKLKVISSPGHTKGSICLVEENEKILFSGDTIFESGFGRTDLYSGDDSELFKSIEKLKAYYRGYRVYPGHGEGFEL